MKNLVLTLLVLLLAFSGFAKTPDTGYKKFYRDYNHTPNTTSFKIPGAFAGIFIDDEDKEVKEFMKNMDDISFFVADKPDKQMIIDLNANLPENLYKQLMVIHNGGSEILFLARDNKGVIEEILMTVVDDSGLVVMCMFGEFTTEDAKKIIKSIKTDSAIKMKN